MRAAPILVAGTFALLGLGLGIANATPITLFNTGVTAPNNANGTNSNVQTTAAAMDPNYVVVSTPAGADGAQALVVTDQPAYFRPGNSQYINDTGSGGNTEPAGHYDYQTTFTIGAGLNPATATLSGTLYADDSIVDVLVNGVSTGINGGGFGSTSGLNFTIPAGFAGFSSGLNTLDFIVNNGGTVGDPTSNNPTAFDATLLRGTVVPEPASLSFLALGGGVALLARRRKA